MEPQMYTISYFKAGDFKDQHNNTWCEATFEELGEPVRWVVKDPSKIEVGQKVYGHIENATSKAGKPYNRFKTDKRPDDTPKSYQPKQSSPEQQEHIARSVALKGAIEFWRDTAVDSSVGLTEVAVLKTADKFLTWLQDTGSQGQGRSNTTSSGAVGTKEAKPQPARDPEYDNLEPPEDIAHLKEEGDSITRDWNSLGKK